MSNRLLGKEHEFQGQLDVALYNVLNNATDEQLKTLHREGWMTDFATVGKVLYLMVERLEAQRGLDFRKKE